MPFGDLPELGPCGESLWYTEGKAKSQKSFGFFRNKPERKAFTEFSTLIYLSYIKKQMQDNNLFKDYTLQQILDKLEVIECFENPGDKL